MGAQHLHLAHANYLGVQRVSHLVNLIEEKHLQLQMYSNAIELNQFGNPNDKIQADEFVSDTTEYLANRTLNLIRETEAVKTNFTTILTYLREQYDQLRVDVRSWKKEKRRFQLGASVDAMMMTFAYLKEKFEILEQLAVASRAHIDRYIAVITQFGGISVSNPDTVQMCQQITVEAHEFQMEIDMFLHQLVQNGMLVVQEPASIIKVSASQPNMEIVRCYGPPCSMEIRFLAGQLSGMIKENMEVETVVIDEYQAKDIVNGQLDPLSNQVVAMGKLSYRITCTVQAPGEFSDGYLRAQFIKARLKRIKRVTQPEIAAKTLYHVLFRIKQVGSAEEGQVAYLSFWTISLPFSMVSSLMHQAKYRRALMFWRLSFFIDDETSATVTYDDQTRVPWSVFFEYLNILFKHDASDYDPPEILHRGLERHISHFKDIISLGCPNELGNGVSWEMFYKRRLQPEESCSFWDWFYPAMNYVAKNCQFWEKGYLLGFASRQCVESVLHRCEDPTMIVRFSNTKPGMIVVSYISRNATGHPEEVEHVIFDHVEVPTFANKSLIELVRLSPKLNCVTKILPVDKSLQEFYELDNTTTLKPNGDKTANGYVKASIQFVWA